MWWLVGSQSTLMCDGEVFVAGRCIHKIGLSLLFEESLGWWMVGGGFRNCLSEIREFQVLDPHGLSQPVAHVPLLQLSVRVSAPKTISHPEPKSW